MIYKCSINHRSGATNDCIYNKTLFIESDSPIAARIIAKKITKNINNVVYAPTIEEWQPPKIDAKCTLESVSREYGSIIVEEELNEI